MPIVVTCPSCPTKLSAPDSAAGKAVRCPKCGATAPVPALLPAEEVPVVEGNLTPPKPKPKPVLAEAEEDEAPRKKPRRDEGEDADEAPRKKARRDEDEEEERPRKKRRRYADDDDDYDFDQPRRKRRPSRSAGGGAMLAVIIVGGLALLIGVGVGIYFLAGKGSPFASKAPVPKGWEAYTNAGGGFKAYLPHKPRSELTLPVVRVGRTTPLRDELQGAESTTHVDVATDDGSILIHLYVVRYPDRMPASVRDKFRNSPPELPIGGGETRKVRWLGNQAVEVTTPEGVARCVCTDKALVVAIVLSPTGGRATKA
jgi:hypothetical protein